MDAVAGVASVAILRRHHGTSSGDTVHEVDLVVAAVLVVVDSAAAVAAVVVEAGYPLEG